MDTRFALEKSMREKILPKIRIVSCSHDSQIYNAKYREKLTHYGETGDNGLLCDSIDSNSFFSLFYYPTPFLW
jgi:hypothetical protein